MSQYFSRVYRGFLVEQTSTGWIVPQLPNWSNGPVPQGPFGTYQIACHIVDRVLDSSQASSQSSQSTPKKEEKEATFPVAESTSEPTYVGAVLSLIVSLLPLLSLVAVLTWVLINGFAKASQFPIFYGVITALDGWFIYLLYDFFSQLYRALTE